MRKLVLLGAAALVATLFLVATPASAQGDQTISSDPAWVPAEEGSATVTINGAGWVGAPGGLFVTDCSGAPDGDSANINADNALAACPLLIPSVGRGNPDADGNWSYELTVTVDAAAIANGTIAVLAGELAAGSPWSAGTNIIVGEPAADAEPMDDDTSLADTGVESGLLAVIGGSVLVAGMLALGLGRRLGRRS